MKEPVWPNPHPTIWPSQGWIPKICCTLELSQWSASVYSEENGKPPSAHRRMMWTMNSQIPDIPLVYSPTYVRALSQRQV